MPSTKISQPYPSQAQGSFPATQAIGRLNKIWYIEWQIQGFAILFLATFDLDTSAQEAFPISKLDELFIQIKQTFLDMQREYPEDAELNSRHAVQTVMEKVSNMDLVAVSKENQELMANAIQRDVAVFSNLKTAVQVELARRLEAYIEEYADEIIQYMENAEA